VFFICTLGITWIGNQKTAPQSVLSGTVAPAQVAPATPAAPAQDPSKPAVPK